MIRILTSKIKHSWTVPSRNQEQYFQIPKGHYVHILELGCLSEIKYMLYCVIFVIGNGRNDDYI